MNHFDQINSKIFSLPDLIIQAESWREKGLKIIFTNGCFDLLHTGHITYLAEAASLGDKLIIAINSDFSVKNLKGNGRPVNDEKTRSLFLASLLFTDAIILFNEETPLELIQKIKPDILVKGGDYIETAIVGADFVKAAGGKVVVLPFVPGYSSTGVIQKIKNIETEKE